jgi:hypothetical protein
MLFLVGLMTAVSAYANPCTAPLECDQRVLEAAADSWHDAQYGHGDYEAGFCVLRRPQADGICDIEIDRIPFTAEKKQITFKLHPMCMAIFHTHPRSAGSEPSSGDQEISNRTRRQMFTISKDGIYRYDPTTRRTKKVHEGAAFDRGCKLQFMKFEGASRLIP